MGLPFEAHAAKHYVIAAFPFWVALGICTENWISLLHIGAVVTSFLRVVTSMNQQTGFLCTESPQSLSWQKRQRIISSEWFLCKILTSWRPQQPTNISLEDFENASLITRTSFKRKATDTISNGPNFAFNTVENFILFSHFDMGVLRTNRNSSLAIQVLCSDKAPNSSSSLYNWKGGEPVCRHC